MGAALTVALAEAIVACSSGGGSAGSNGADSGPIAPLDSGTPAVDAPSDTAALDGNAPLDGAEDGGATDADAALGPVALLGTIPLSGTPTAMAFNPATNVLYVALASSSGAGAGIAVIDATTNTVATTIGSPGDASVPSPVVAMAVDVASNVLYVADSAPTAQTVYAIDGLTNLVTSATMLGVVRAMAVETSTHAVYMSSAEARRSHRTGRAEVIVPAAITVLGGVPSEAAAAPTTVVPGDVALSGSAFALDETNHRLYLCGPNALAFANGGAALRRGRYARHDERAPAAGRPGAGRVRERGGGGMSRRMGRGRGGHRERRGGGLPRRPRGLLGIGLRPRRGCRGRERRRRQRRVLFGSDQSSGT